VTPVNFAGFKLYRVDKIIVLMTWKNSSALAPISGVFFMGWWKRGYTCLAAFEKPFLPLVKCLWADIVLAAQH
jgi:hypothetical protein